VTGETFECDHCGEEFLKHLRVQTGLESLCPPCFDNYDGPPHPVHDDPDFPGFSADH
jgi:hypothetical protein